jgi:hypothetical protein
MSKPTTSDPFAPTASDIAWLKSVSEVTDDEQVRAELDRLIAEAESHQPPSIQPTGVSRETATQKTGRIVRPVSEVGAA